MNAGVGGAGGGAGPAGAAGAGGTGVNGGTNGTAGAAGGDGVAGNYGAKGAAAASAIDGSQAALPAIRVSPKTLPDGKKGQAYAASLTAKGGRSPHHWAAFGLPSGLSLNPKTGALGGTPTAAGTFTVEVLVTDSRTPTAAAGVAKYTIAVAK